MRILKQKLERAEKLRNDKSQGQKLRKMDRNDQIIVKEEPTEMKEEQPTRKLRPRLNIQPSKPIIPPRHTPSSKNIMKNYSRALAHFAVSEMAAPHLAKILKKEGIEKEQFCSFIEDYKDSVNCIKNLREMLLIEPQEDAQNTGIKRAFMQICEVFLKFFSVNWIFHSKIRDRLVHLKYRFKILRRIRHPEHFTYLDA